MYDLSHVTKYNNFFKCAIYSRTRVYQNIQQEPPIYMQNHGSCRKKFSSKSCKELETCTPKSMERLSYC